jgi:uncharacterized repeat protein (TIGR03803 family)
MDSSGSVTILHSFDGTTTGSVPASALIESTDGYFYGTTQSGGSSSGGVAFRMDGDGNVTVLRSFDSSTGTALSGDLLEGSDGYFYGTARTGGTQGNGTAFRMDASGGVTVLHSFDAATTGDYPYAGLVEASDGLFYGTTTYGGSLGYGTVFSMSAAGSVTVLHSFDVSATGAYSIASVIQAADGFIYGVTNYGGTDVGGTAFRIDDGGAGAGGLTDLTSAEIWLGLKNSDDVGTRFDLLAEVLHNGDVVGSGQLDDVSGGSSGFNNANLHTIGLTLPSPVNLSSGDTLSLRLSVRVAATGHQSGTARLWFNDDAANSRLGVEIDGTPESYYLVGTSSPSSFALSPGAPGEGPKRKVDVSVNRAVDGNPFEPFGTWTVVIP